jgi:hypothetical protein
MGSFDNMPDWAVFILYLIGILLFIFILLSWLSPMHLTYIMFADFVFYPQEESSTWFYSLGITLGIWFIVIGLYFVITVCLIR